MKTARARLLRDSPLLSSWLVCFRSSGSDSQSRVKTVLASRPSPCNAAAVPFCRGKAASWRKITEAVTTPLRMDMAIRRMSSQWVRMSPTLIRTAISGSSDG